MKRLMEVNKGIFGDEVSKIMEYVGRINSKEVIIKGDKKQKLHAVGTISVNGIVVEENKHGSWDFILSFCRIKNSKKLPNIMIYETLDFAEIWPNWFVGR